MFNRIIFVLSFFFSLEKLCAQDTTQHIIAGRLNSKEQVEKPYVILISADGFRHDFAKRYHAENLLRLSNKGVAASSMLSSFPSLTFPNHYTIITGLYPSHHGIVNNSFYDEKKSALYSLSKASTVRDSSWYGGVPLWALAEQKEMLSASFYWVGSESGIGLRPTYYYSFSTKIGIDDRIKGVKRWLELPTEERPHLITFYLPQVDGAAHVFGPESKQTGDAVQFIDETIGKMVASIDSLHLPVNFIFVSDHGMTVVDTLNWIPLPPVIDTSKFIIPSGETLLQLYAKDKNDVMPLYGKLKAAAKDYDVYLPEETPKAWHYGKRDDRYNRLGDIILVPHLPKVFNIYNRHISLGAHGFDPVLPDMGATFFAWGPAFKDHEKIGAFENVNVYPLVAKILGLSTVGEIDGHPDVLKSILK